MRETIIVYLSGALGDVILTSPALALVRTWRPEAHLQLIAPRAAHELYPALHDSWTDVNAACVAELFARGCGEALARHERWRYARAAIVFEHEDSALVRALSAALPVHAIDARPSCCAHEHYAMHVWRATQRIVGMASAFIVPVPAMRAPDKAPEGAWALVHAGSGAPRKNAPPALLAQACHRACAGRAWRWLLLEGESDAPASAAFRAAWAGEIAALRVSDLRVLAWYLAHAQHYVGNDSGVSHLAGVLGVRGTVFFGPTEPAIWRPLGNTLTVERFGE